MNLKEIRKLVGDKVSAKRIQAAIKKISPAEFKREMGKKEGSILQLIKKKIKVSKSE